MCVYMNREGTNMENTEDMDKDTKNQKKHNNNKHNIYWFVYWYKIFLYVDNTQI
jgi:hypothetical protein